MSGRYLRKEERLIDSKKGRKSRHTSHRDVSPRTNHVRLPHTSHRDVSLRKTHVRPMHKKKKKKRQTHLASRRISASNTCQTSISLSSNRGIRGPPRDDKSRGGVLEIEDTDVTRYRPRTRNHLDTSTDTQAQDGVIGSKADPRR